jgi:hypothetical protein
MRTLAFLLCTTVTHAFAPAMLFPSGGVLRRELASPRAHSPRVAFRAHPLRLRMQKSPQTVEVPDTIEVEDDLLRPAGRIASTAPEAIEAEALRLMDMPDGVVCDPRGVCVIPDDEEEIAERPLGEWGPRIMLLAVCVAYGSNFAFGHILNDAMPSSVACGLRFSLAALALAPFLPQLERRLVFPAVASSLAISAAYVGQVLSLQTVSAGKVGFICSLSVIVCPILEVLFDGRKVCAHPAPVGRFPANHIRPAPQPCAPAPGPAREPRSRLGGQVAGVVCAARRLRRRVPRAHGR